MKKIFFAALFLLAVSLGISQDNSAYATEPQVGTFLSLIPLDENNFPEWYWFNSVNIRDEPSLRGKVIANVTLPQDDYGFYQCRDVLYLGVMSNGWLKVERSSKDYPIQCPTKVGWVYGEFFGVVNDTPIETFEKPVSARITATEVLGRVGPSFYASPKIYHSDFCHGGICGGGYTYKGGETLTLVGRHGNWLQTDKGLWIFEDLIEIQ